MKEKIRLSGQAGTYQLWFSSRQCHGWIGAHHAYRAKIKVDNDFYIEVSSCECLPIAPRCFHQLKLLSNYPGVRDPYWAHPDP